MLFHVTFLVSCISNTNSPTLLIFSRRHPFNLVEKSDARLRHLTAVVSYYSDQIRIIVPNSFQYKYRSILSTLSLLCFDQKGHLLFKAVRRTSICRSTIPRLVPPMACRLSTLASKLNTPKTSSENSSWSDLKSCKVRSFN